MSASKLGQFEEIYWNEGNKRFLSSVKKLHKLEAELSEKEQNEDLSPELSEELKKVRENIDWLYQETVVPFIGILSAESANDNNKPDNDNAREVEGVEVDEGKLWQADEETKEEAKKFAERERADKKENRAISEMDYQALKSHEVVGRISPPSRGFFAKEVNMPTPAGFRKIKASVEVQKKATLIEMSEDEKLTEGQIEITIPISSKTKMLPLPLGYKAISCDDEEGILVGEVGGNSPFGSYLLDSVETNPLTYIIEPVKKFKSPLKPFTPDKNEMAYWKNLLPMPTKLVRLAEEKPEEAPLLIARFVKDNFFYICNDEIGEMLNSYQNSDDYPLILSELGGGHCDLLSWLAAGYMRAFGIPAVVRSGAVSDREGRAFMKNYGHSVVSYLDHQGVAVTFDPSLECPDISEALSNVDLTDELDQFEEELAEAASDKEKREAVKKMKRKITQKSVEIDPIDEDDPLPFRILDSGIDISNTPSVLLPVADINDNKLKAHEDFRNKDFESLNFAEREELLENIDELEKQNNLRQFFEKLDFKDRRKWADLFESINRWNFPVGLMAALDIDEKKNAFRFSDFSIALREKNLDSEPVIKNIRDLAKKKMSHGSFIMPTNIHQASLGKLTNIDDNFNFSKSFTKKIPDILALWKENFHMFANFDDIENLGKKNILNTTEVVEASILSLLLVKAFLSKETKATLTDKYGLSDEFFLAIAKQLSPLGGETTYRKTYPISKTPIPESRREKYREYQQLKDIFKLDEGHKMRVKNFVDLFNKFGKSVPSYSTDDFNIDIKEYERDSDDAKDIYWPTSSSTGVLHVKKPKIQSPQKEICLFLEFSEPLTNLAYDFGLISYYAAAIEAAKYVAKRNNVKIKLTTPQQESFVEITAADSQIDPLQMAIKIACLQEGNSTFIRPDQMPKNLLVLTWGDAGAEATRVAYGKKTRLLVKTYEELGPVGNLQMREEFVRNGLKE